MEFIFRKYRGTDVVPFPGLEFGMDTDEGRKYRVSFFFFRTLRPICMFPLLPKKEKT